MFKPNCKKFLGLLMILALCLVLAGCGANTDPALSDDVEAVNIGLLAIDDSFPFYVAQEEGLFTKHGVNVNLVTFSSARDKETALEAGQIDGDMTDMVVLGLLKKGGLDTKIVTTALGATPKEGRFLLLAAPGSGIETVADLKGQPVGIGNNTIIQFMGDQMFGLNGFTADDINTQNIPDLKLRLDTLMEGKSLKAAILPDPLASLGALEGAKILLDDTQLEADGQPLNLSQSVVIFSEASLAAKGDDIKKAVAAYDEAKDLINANPDKYRSALLEFSKVPAALGDSYTMPTYTARTVPAKEELDRVMAWMQAKGLLDQAYNYKDLVDLSFTK